MIVLQRIGQWLLAMTLALAAGFKLAGLFRPAVAQSAKTLFETLPLPGQWTLVTVELILAAWLVSGWRPRLGAFAAITLLSTFLAAVLIEMAQPAPRDCGCLGTLLKTNGHLGPTLTLDIALLAIALAIYYSTLLARPKPH